MYKKITHTIVEEHFDKPSAAEIKNLIEDGYSDMRSMFSPTTAGKFKTDINGYFNQLHLRLTNIAIATENGNMDTLLTEETAFFDEVDDLGKILLPYYGIEYSQRLNQNLRAVGLSFVGIDRNLKFKTDITLLVNRLDQTFDQIGNLLNQYNNKWQNNLVRNTWVAIRDGLVSEATAIINKDTTASVAEHTQVADKFTAFANELADSVIQQYPNKFIL